MIEANTFQKSIFPKELKINAAKSSQARLILAGFTHEEGRRVFAFEHVKEKVSVTFTVSAQLTLAQRYGIRLQELPMLCRQFLEERLEKIPRAIAQDGRLVFGEVEMGIYEKTCRLAEEKRRGARRLGFAPVATATS